MKDLWLGTKLACRRREAVQLGREPRRTGGTAVADEAEGAPAEGAELGVVPGPVCWPVEAPGEACPQRLRDGSTP